eukprot:scaffold301_cov393-Prasinococcus_capsulatus_cf.AAC.10
MAASVRRASAPAGDLPVRSQSAAGTSLPLRHGRPRPLTHMVKSVLLINTSAAKWAGGDTGTCAVPHPQRCRTQGIPGGASRPCTPCAQSPGRATVPYTAQLRPPSAADLQVDVASIQGGPLVFDPLSQTEPWLTEYTKRFDGDKSAAVSSLKLSDIVNSLTTTYDAIYLTGGHGTIVDYPNNPDVIKAVESMYAAGAVPAWTTRLSCRVRLLLRQRWPQLWQSQGTRSDMPRCGWSGKHVAACCHGPVGLVNCKKPSGEPLVRGLRVTGFTDAEEKAVGAYELANPLIEASFRVRPLASVHP